MVYQSPKDQHGVPPFVCVCILGCIVYMCVCVCVNLDNVGVSGISHKTQTHFNAVLPGQVSSPSCDLVHEYKIT